MFFFFWIFQAITAWVPTTDLFSREKSVATLRTSTTTTTTMVTLFFFLSVSTFFKKKKKKKKKKMSSDNNDNNNNANNNAPASVRGDLNEVDIFDDITNVNLNFNSNPDFNLNGNVFKSADSKGPQLPPPTMWTPDQITALVTSVVTNVGSASNVHVKVENVGGKGGLLKMF